MKKLIIVSLVLALFGCEEKSEFSTVEPVKAPDEKPAAAEKKEAAKTPTSAPAKMPAASPIKNLKFASLEEYGKTGPVTWTAPATWTAAKPASSMRLAEYTIAGKDGAEPSSVSIFFFGGGQGGDVEQNVSRWVGQFATADGKPLGDAAKRGLVKVDGMDVHTVDAAGTYNPGMAGGNRPPKQDQRMLGAIVELPGGRYFFKLVGPKAGVDAEQKNFDAFVQSFKKGK